jgi:hypothetical protein
MLAKVDESLFFLLLRRQSNPPRRIALFSLKPATAFLTILAIAVMVGCSGNSRRTIVQPGVMISISPNTSVTLPAGGTQAFTASVQNAADTNVTWLVNQVSGGSSSTGTISSTGLYTAPSVQSPTVFTITAVAAANTSITASASVMVTPLVSVTLNIHSASVKTTQSQQFSATVVNTTNTAVTWQVNGITNGNSTVGTISATGLYTAPSTVPTPNPVVTVTAVSVADPTKSDSASVTITLTVVINVSVNPPTANVVVGGTQAFTATVTGTPNTAVTWSLGTCSAGAGLCGSIDPGGLYSAPGTVPSPATVTVIATSQADGTTTGTATVTVIAHLGVSISPPGPITVGLGSTQMFTATVVGDPLNLGVNWTLTCMSDVENPPDCAGSGNDGDSDISTLSNQTNFSVIFNAAPGPGGGQKCDENIADCVLTLTATTVETDGSGAQTATVTITVP